MTLYLKLLALLLVVVFMSLKLMLAADTEKSGLGETSVKKMHAGSDLQSLKYHNGTGFPVSGHSQFSMHENSVSMSY